MKRIFLSIIICLPVWLIAQHTGNIHQQQISPADHLQNLSSYTSQSFSPPTLDPNFFYVNVKVLYNQVPDAYLAIFNVLQMGENAQEANQLMELRLQAVMEGLDELGLPESDVFVDMISQLPIYEYQMQKKVFSKSYQEIPAGIELQKNLHIRFSDGNLMADLVQLMAEQEIFELVKVDYLVKNQGNILQEVRKAAIAFGKEQLKTYETLGVRYDTLPRIFNESQQVVFPLSRYMSYPSKSSSSLLEKIKDESQVQQLRTPKVVYYQSLPSDDYEVVIHPLVNEPSVQYHYEIMIRYQLHPPQPQIRVEQKTIREKEFIILTPDGNTRTLLLDQQESP